MFAGRDGFEKHLRTLAKAGPLVGTRVHAYNPDRLPPFDKPELKALWKAAADSGLAVQIHFEPKYAEGFEPLIKEFPGTRVFVDGTLRGTCPVRDLPLAAGSHTVRFLFEPTGESKAERVVVRPGERVTLRADFTGTVPQVRIER